MGRSFLLSPSCSQSSSGSPTGDDRLRVLALGLGFLFMLAELHRLNDSIFFFMEPWRTEDEQKGVNRNVVSQADNMTELIEICSNHCTL